MKTKIDIISGFLGAGKTTLIRKLALEEYHRERVVVIENEFGKVNIDGEVLRNSGITVKEITAGCICCSLSDDLGYSIEKVIETFKPERIIIEPTGVARLSDVIKSCMDKRISELSYINNVITVVDVRRYKLSMAISKEFFENQIRATKSIILSKIKDVSEESIKEIIVDLLKINNKVNIIRSDWDKVGAKELLSSVENNEHSAEEGGKKANKIIGGRIHRSDKEVKLDTWEFETKECFDSAKIQKIFKQLQKQEDFGLILRGKGILKDFEGKSFNFNYVPEEITFERCSTSEEGRICIIGIDINKRSILQLFL